MWLSSFFPYLPQPLFICVSGHTLLWLEPSLFLFQLCGFMSDSAHAVWDRFVCASSTRLMTSISLDSYARSVSCLLWDTVSPAYWAWASTLVYCCLSGRQWGGFSYFSSPFICHDHTFRTQLFVSCLRDVYFIAVIRPKLLWQLYGILYGFSSQGFTATLHTGLQEQLTAAACYAVRLFAEIRFD